MFDVSFTELMVIGVVALIVIGPERLPRVAKTIGHLLGRAQRYVSDVKGDIRREIELDDLRKFKSEMDEAAQSVQSTLRDTEHSLRSHGEQLRSVLDKTAQDAQAGLKSDEATASAPESSDDSIPSLSPAIGMPTGTGPTGAETDGTVAPASASSPAPAASAAAASAPTASAPAASAPASSAPAATASNASASGAGASAGPKPDTAGAPSEAPLSLASAAFGTGTSQTPAEARPPAEPTQRPAADAGAASSTTRSAS